MEHHPKLNPTQTHPVATLQVSTHGHQQHPQHPESPARLTARPARLPGQRRQHLTTRGDTPWVAPSPRADDAPCHPNNLRSGPSRADNSEPFLPAEPPRG